LAAFIESNPSVSAKDVHDKIEELGIRPDKAVAVLVQLLFTDKVVAELTKKKAYFGKVT
jgi:hypothetical protein